MKSLENSITPIKKIKSYSRNPAILNMETYVHRFRRDSKYVDGEFAGVLDFTLLPTKLVLERFRLNKRGRGLGTALAKWLKDFAQNRNISHIETFEFIHFIHLHVLGKIFQPLTVKEQGRNYRAVTVGEAQRLAIENPTGHIFRLVVPPRISNFRQFDASAAKVLEQAA